MKTNYKNKSLEILFNPKHSSYNIMCSHTSALPDSFYLPSDNIEKDALVNIIKNFERIKFVGLNSLINFCKSEKHSSLQLVLEWVNMFIYREERKQFEAYRSQSNLVIGISNLLDEFKKENEECQSVNGFKFYTSELRTNLTKLITQLIINSDTLIGTNDYMAICNKLILNIFSLNFEETLKIFKEADNSKDLKIPNEDNTFFMLFQEAINQFLSNSTGFNIFTILEKTQSTSSLQFVNLFIQQKLNTKLNEFLYNNEISILLKLVYILKNNNYSDLINHLEMLQNYYAENGMLEGLILTGDSYKSIVLLQNYLDKTDSILVPVILSKFFVDQNEKFYTQIEDTLNETLNRMKMFNERIFLNQKLNEIVSHLEKGFRIQGDKKSSSIINSHNSTEMILSCFYCNAKIHAERADQFKNLFIHNKEENIDFCPKCLKKLPNCAICLASIDINIPAPKSKTGHHASDSKRVEGGDEYKPDLKYVWCTKCRHGGHIDHIKEWFADLLVCPVADCNCICLEYNHIII